MPVRLTAERLGQPDDDVVGTCSGMFTPEATAAAIVGSVVSGWATSPWLQPVQQTRDPGLRGERPIRVTSGTVAHAWPARASSR
jgi:hypothetical protein